MSKIFKNVLTDIDTKKSSTAFFVDETPHKAVIVDDDLFTLDGTAYATDCIDDVLALVTAVKGELVERQAEPKRPSFAAGGYVTSGYGTYVNTDAHTVLLNFIQGIASKRLAEPA